MEIIIKKKKQKNVEMIKKEKYFLVLIFRDKCQIFKKKMSLFITAQKNVIHDDKNAIHNLLETSTHIRN